MSLLSVSATSAPSSAVTQSKIVQSDKRNLTDTAAKSMPLDENSIDTDSQSTGQGEPSSKCFMKMSLEGSNVKSTASASEAINLIPVKCTKTITSILSTSKNRSVDLERSNESVELNTSSETSDARPISDEAKKSVSFSDQMEHIESTTPTRRAKDTKPSSKHPSITERLPANTYYCDPPNLYVFPGAEIWWDDDDESSYADDDEDDDENDGDDTADDDDIDINCDENDDGTKTTHHEHCDDDFSVRLSSIDDEMARQSPPTAPLSPSNTKNVKQSTKRRRRSSSAMDCGISDVTGTDAIVTNSSEAISEAPSGEKKRKLCADGMDEISSTILTASMTSTPAKRCATPSSLTSNDI